MTVVQEVLLELENDYMGHPYFVPGHALYSAVARRVDDAVCRALSVSTGVFVPGEHGAYPAWHSQSGGVPYMGAGLRPVEAYEDLFLFRGAAQRWLSESRPREAHNTFGLREYGDRTALGSTRSFGLPEERRASQRSVSWYVHWYVHAAGGRGGGRGSEVVPLEDEVLDGLRLGGGRNYGFGVTSLVDSQVIDVAELDYNEIREADAHRLELVSPFVLASEFPGADRQRVPWWWECEGDERLRRRDSQLVKGGDVYEVATVDHGQVVGYAGDRPVETAKNGIRGVGTHAQYGFGEIRVWPGDADRVFERATRGATSDQDHGKEEVS